MQSIEDLKIETLHSKVIAVIGYGSQGKAQALNMKDSGLNVIIGLNPSSKSFQVAKDNGFEVLNIKEAAKKADILFLLTPDETHGKIFLNDIKGNLKQGGIIVVAHGFSFHFNYVEDYKDYNILMLAPKAIGPAVRRNFIEKNGMLSLLAVFYSFEKSEDVLINLKELAKAIGCTQVMQTTFKEECEVDLFSEQAVLCGGVISLFSKAFEVLCEKGYKPEVAYFECICELKLIVDLIYTNGTGKMFSLISNAAKYGGLKAGDYLIDDSIKEKMEVLLTNIQNGSFANDFMNEVKNGYKFKGQIAKKYEDSKLEQAFNNIKDITK